MTPSFKNIVLGICAAGVAVGSVFASISANKYKIRMPDGTFLSVKGNGCSGSGSLKCIVKVKTLHGSVTLFERATLFDQNDVTVAGSSHLLCTFHTLGD